MDLTARRNEIAEQNRKAENTRGSGWHVADLGAEARDHELKLSERPIVLQDNDLILAVAPDVARIKEGCTAFLAKVDEAKKTAAERGWDEPDIVGHGIKYQQQMARHCRRVLAMSETLELPTQTWNYVNQALALVNVQTVSATAEVRSLS